MPGRGRGGAGAGALRRHPQRHSAHSVSGRAETSESRSQFLGKVGSRAEDDAVVSRGNNTFRFY